ncbi:MAG: tetraacyldisaccharide 4'-kinase [Pyrinomonadaceae bacterium]
MVKLKIAMSLSWIYSKIISARNQLYDRGVFEIFDLGARTISIGNITTGGTGKTPLVAYVASILAERGERVCILTRGYGRKDANKRVLVSDGAQILADPIVAGDEPFELAQKLLGKAMVIADADRVSAAEWAKRKFGITAFVLDDGFQHRKAKRDVDIVCVDATDSFGGGKTLPAGRLREPISNLARADIVVITRANLAGDISNLKFEISDLNNVAGFFVAKNEVVHIIPLKEFHAKTQRTQSEKPRGEHASERTGVTNIQASTRTAFVFCGIGNPQNFFDQLRQESLSFIATETFRDHHLYTQRDVDDLEILAREKGAEIFLTTAKDAVKLSDLKFEIPCYVVEIEMLIDDPAAFAALL